MAKITVIGAGLMGHGIALTFARASHVVTVQDPFPKSLETLPARIEASLKVLGDTNPALTLANITTETDISLAAAAADMVFEAAPEKLPLKQQIFATLESVVPDHCILASNTSVIPITKIMAGLTSRHRALGTHWWNPPHMIPLVEVIRTEWTDDACMDQMVALLADVGKTPVRVERDTPGFIGNRLQHALWREAVSLVENGVCDARAVDTVVKASFGRRLAVLGPLETADMVGTDLTLDIHENLLHDLDSRPGPSPYLQQLVQAGDLGMKSGQGFRDWTEEESESLRAKVAAHLSLLEKIL